MLHNTKYSRSCDNKVIVHFCTLPTCSLPWWSITSQYQLMTYTFAEEERNQLRMDECAGQPRARGGEEEEEEEKGEEEEEGGGGRGKGRGEG